MVEIAATAAVASGIYARMERNLAIVRRHLGKPLTLSDKVLLGHLDDPNTRDLDAGRSYLALRPDRVVFQDVLGQSGLLQFMQTQRDRVAVRDDDSLRPSDPGSDRWRGGPAGIA